MRYLVHRKMVVVDADAVLGGEEHLHALEAGEVERSLGLAEDGALKCLRIKLRLA